MTESTPPSARARAPRVQGTVRIVGAGLLGASIGHALSALGIDVALDDTSPAQLRLAVDYGAGRRAAEDDDPSLIVVAVPPDVTADVIERERSCCRFLQFVLTVPPGDGPFQLDITGPDGTTGFLAEVSKVSAR